MESVSAVIRNGCAEKKSILICTGHQCQPRLYAAKKSNCGVDNLFNVVALETVVPIVARGITPD